MNVTGKHGFAHLPITALAIIDCQKRFFLLVGLGTRLELLDPAAKYKLDICNVLAQQAVHGVLVVSQHDDDGVCQAEILAWGGHQVSWLSVTIHYSDDRAPGVEALKRGSIRLNDWVLQCKVSQNSPIEAYALTSHNVVHRLSLESHSAKSLTRQTSSTPLRTFLYCGTLREVDGELIVAAGTAFGEVLLWQMHANEHAKYSTSILLDSFEDHSGSIFGTSIASPLTQDGEGCHTIASCSDDRTIRLWNMLSAKNRNGLNDRENTKCGKIHSELSTNWAHLSRIWDVEFVFNTGHDLGLLSFGEDGAVHSWTANIESSPGTSKNNTQRSLLCRSSDRHHNGKNIWSHAELALHGRTIVFTGGADGQVISRKISWSPEDSCITKLLSNRFADMLACDPRVKSLRSYKVQETGHVIAFTDRGHVVEASVSGSQMSWVLRDSAADARFLLLCINSINDLIFYYDSSTRNIIHLPNGRSDAINCAFDVNGAVSSLRLLSCNSSDHSGGAYEVCLMLSYFDRQDADLLWLELADHHFSSYQFKLNASSTVVQLPDTFLVASAAYDSTHHILVCGSRAGALAAYHNVSRATSSADTCVCERHIHASDAITDIALLNNTLPMTQESHSLAVCCLTTGRDGTYAIHQFVSNDLNQILSIQTVHRAATFLGSDIEGVHVVRPESGDAEILLHGFRATEFIVWNETRNRQVFAIECGGSHRSWAFQPRHGGHAGTFVWTKAGSCSLATYEEPNHQVLRQGGHGREIKTIAVHRESENLTLIATGAEDTEIRLFHYQHNDDEFGALRSLHVMRKHTTGIQNLRFSRDGSILFSSGGVEELFAWKLSKVPVVGVGSVFHAALPRDDVRSDARIMSFDVQETLNDTTIRLVVAYSNGKAKAFDYYPDAQSYQALTPVWQTDFGTLCLTQAIFSNSSIPCASALPRIVLGATNGRLTCLKTVQDLVTRPSHQVHQNSVTALCVLENNRHMVAISGGDDSSLAVTMIADGDELPTFRTVRIPSAHAAAVTAVTVIKSQFEEAADPTPSELEINADKADTTHLPPYHHFIILSAANDQRVKAWSLRLKSDTKPESTHCGNLLDHMEIKPVGEWYTNVADISGMEILRTQQNKRTSHSTRTMGIEVVVVGIGMESMSLDIAL